MPRKKFFVSPTQNDVHKVGLGKPKKKSVKHRHKNVVGAIQTHRHAGGNEHHRHPDLPVYLGPGGASGGEKALAGATVATSAVGLLSAGNLARKGIKKGIKVAAGQIAKRKKKFSVSEGQTVILTKTEPLTVTHDYAIFSSVVVTLGAFTIGKKLWSIIFDEDEEGKKHEVRAWAKSPEEAQSMASSQYPEFKDRVPPALLVSTALRVVSSIL